MTARGVRRTRTPPDEAPRTYKRGVAGGLGVWNARRIMIMEVAAGPPGRWLVTLRSGAVLELAADGYTEHEGYAVFSVLARGTAEEREQVQILDWALEAETVLVLVAEVPMAAVSNIEGGGPGRGASTHAETGRKPAG
jgi:hypothetical protein